VLDLAYKIHTEIGDHTIGAFLQYSDGDGVLRGREVRPDHVLQTGDIVHIRTARDVHPTLDWLDLARTRYAREKITRALRMQQRLHEQEAAGLAGAGLTPRSLPDGTPQPLRHPGGGLAQVRLARCCCPIPGDGIAGLAQAGRRVAIHRGCCRTLAAALARRKARGSRHAEPLRVTWAEIRVQCYWAPLLISGQDHPGLMHEVSKCANTLGLGVTRSFASANTSRYKAHIAITLEIPTKVTLEYVARRLRRIPGIVDVQRDTAKGCSESRP